MNLRETVSALTWPTISVAGLLLDAATHSKYSPFERYSFGPIIGDYIGDYQFGFYTALGGIATHLVSRAALKNMEPSKRNKVAGLIALGAMSLPWGIILANESIGLFGGTPHHFDLIAPCIALFTLIKSYDVISRHLTISYSRGGEPAGYLTG